MERRTRIRRAIRVLPKLGLVPLARNFGHRVRAATGWYERLGPVRDWRLLPEAIIESARPAWPAPPTRAALLEAGADLEATLAVAERIAGGERLLFSDRWERVSPSLLSDPGLAEGHWTEPPLPDGLDRRSEWERARFDFVPPLARAWRLTGDERWPEAFWGAFEGFWDEHPPNGGLHWNCGQECALRLTALVLAASVFADAASTTRERMRRLWSAVAELAERVDAGFLYALSQVNTHALSEGTALFLAARSLPGHPQAPRWEAAALRHVQAQTLEQFAPDGTYRPTSLNYTRMALRTVGVWLASARHEGVDVPEEVRQRIAAGVDFLGAFTDEANGRVPDLGANDGTNIWAFSGQPFEDYRGVLQVVGALADGTLRCVAGPWDEEVLWVGLGLEGERAPLERRTRRFPDGGYHLVRTPRTFAHIRCTTYDYRPSQADMLHLDLWRDHRPLLRDGGSYRYTDRSGLAKMLKGVEGHNTVQIDGRDQMEHVSNFLYADWLRSRLWAFGERALPGFEGTWFDGEHYGYGRRRGDTIAGVVHRRRLAVLDSGVLVIDDLLMTTKHRCRATWRWHLTDEAGVLEDSPGGSEVPLGDWTLCALHGGDARLLRGPEHLAETARSPRYGRVEPGVLLRADRDVVGPTRVVTSIGALRVQPSEEGWRWGPLSIPSDPALAPRRA